MGKYCRVLVFKEPPQLVYTGLNKVIGKPRELEKNLEELAYFDSEIDIKIPLDETNEYNKHEE